MPKVDLNSAVPVDTQGNLLPEIDLSSAREVSLLETPSEKLAEGYQEVKQEHANRLRDFVGKVGYYATFGFPEVMKAGAEPGYEYGGTRVQRGAGTAIREMLDVAFEFATPTHKGIMKSFIAGYAPELNPDYPPDKIMTIGQMFKRWSDDLSKNYGELIYPHLSKETVAMNIAQGIAILSEASGKTVFDIAGMVGDYYTNPIDYLTLRAVSKGMLTALSDIPLFKRDLLRDLQMGFRGPETVTLKSEGGDLFKNTIKGVLREGEIKDLADTLGGKEALETFYRGEPINLPLSKGILLTDKPYWASIKKFFGKEPTTMGIRIFAGEPKPTLGLLGTRGELTIPPEWGDILRYGTKGVGRFLRMQGTQEAVLMLGGAEVVAKLSELEFVRKQLPERVPIFYSRLPAVLAQKMPESAPVSQIRGILQSSQIPKEEIEWSGLEDFLKGKTKVGKTELLDYLQKNQLTIEETIKAQGEGRNSTPEEEGRFRQLEQLNEMGRLETADLQAEFLALSEKAENRERPKYSDSRYNVVTENYKEMLLKVPTPELITPTTAKEYEQRMLQTYKEPHWDEPNVFAHARIADVTDEQGRKGLFVNEIQSQWALEARKGEGKLEFKPNITLSQITQKELDKGSDYLGNTALHPIDPQDLKQFEAGDWALYEDGDFLDILPHSRNIEREIAKNQFLRDYMQTDEERQFIKGGGGIPYHPAVSRWHEIILKRLLRYAAENGYDFVTWATGEQVAEYYNLAKQVDAIHYIDNKDGTYRVSLIKDGIELESNHIENKEELQRFVGKDIANRIVRGEGKKPKPDAVTGFTKGGKEISGEGLKVGGAWAQNLYDRQIPNWLNDYAKKFGAQVETVMIPTKYGEVETEEMEGVNIYGEETYKKEKVPTSQQSLAITPQMKQALLTEGQPVFGKMPKEVGVPGKEAPSMKIFRMDEEMKIVNTKGEIVTLPKGEEYRTLPVYDAEGNIVENKIKLVDGKQVTVYEGELRKLKGKILGEGEQPMAGGKVHPPAPEEGRPPEEKPRQKERKEEMLFWNSPDITSKLFFGEKEFLKKYIDEGKSLKQIAKELGEDIEDTKKTEQWTHAHMNEIADEMREGMAEAGRQDLFARKGELRAFLTGQLNPALKEEGEYSKLKLLPWLWAPEGKGVRADDLTELSEMGFPVESGADIIALIEYYFDKEIAGRGEEVAAEYDKTRVKELRKGLAPTKAKKVPPVKPERAITGIGNGSVISEKADESGEELHKIFKGMPFALLGSKARVLARLTNKLKITLKQGIKKVYDLFGGAKGYRSGLFFDLPAADYNLNEGSDERANYYRNIQDPTKHAVMKKILQEIMDKFTGVMKNAFGLPEAKSDKDFLEMLNSWLLLGLRNERYYFASEIISDFWDQIQAEAKADNYASPESSAKYYFLENMDVYGEQHIVGKIKGKAYIIDVLNKVRGLADKLDIEAKRDAGMPVTQEDAWTKMDTLVQDLNTGKIIPQETCVLIDPQYLNPTEKAGTYTVGQADTTWEGHKQNLEKHLLPLIKTGVKIIYTDNADPELIKWMQAHKLPYNIEKSIGAVAERRGRDEIISFIGFNLGDEWTVGRVQPGGEGAVKPGQQYVAPRVTGQSERFTAWLEQRQLAQEAEVKKQELMVKIEQLRQSKMLSKITVSRIKKYLGIREMKNTGIEQIQKMVDYIEGLKIGDKLLSENQIKTLEKIFGEIKDIAITPKRIAIERFGEEENVLEGMLVGRLPNELMPTVDVKEGHPAIAKVINETEDNLAHAEQETERRDIQFEEMIRKAEKSRKTKLDLKEKLKRTISPQNKEIFAALGGQQVDLTKEEVAVVAYLKNFFKMVREKLKPEKYRKKYVPHMAQPFTEKILERGIIGGIQQFFKERKLMKKDNIPIDVFLELDNIIGSEKFFRFFQERKGIITPTTNLRKILHDYSSLYETKLALDEILPAGQTISKFILQHQSASWMKKFLQNLKGRGLDYELRRGKMGWAATTGDAIIDIIYFKLLALNKWSPFKNLLAGETNAFIWQSSVAYLKGKQRLATNPIKAYKMAVEHRALEGLYVEFAQKGIGKLKKLQDLGMMGQKLGEFEIRTCMFVGELTDQEWETGEISTGRVRALNDPIAITQGKFSKVETPLWVQTTIGRAIFQMNRWRITDFMMARRIINDAKREYKKGNFKGEHTDRLIKMLLFFGIGMYLRWELGKRGYKKAAQVVQSMAEVINSTLSLITQGDLKQMITDNPTLTVLNEILFSVQALTNYIHIPGAEKPRKIEIQEGIEETYIAPVETIEDILETFE